MILALQTADVQTHMWLFADSTAPEALASHDWDSGRQLSDHLLGQIQEFLATHNLTLADLKGLAIFSGPGSFTSLRIGHTVVNALADSLDIPIVGASGEHWLRQAVHSLAKAKLGQAALPYYGSEAHITRPKS